MRVGFAGLGRMGSHMARNLSHAGFDLGVWNRTAQTAKRLSVELECYNASSPRALSDWADVVVTMLADDQSSLAVHAGLDGLFAGKAPVLIEMGTMSPDHISQLMDLAPPHMQIIDAPVSGATQAAKDAQLMIMAGCTADQAAAYAAVFDALGRQTIYLGQAGAGTVMKLAVNSLIHGINQSLAEAMTLVEAAGIAAETAFDVIEASAAAAPMLSYRRPLYLDETSHDVTFTVALARKDMAVTAALAETLGTQMPQGRITLEKLMQAEAAGYGLRDMAAMLDFMRKERP